MKIILLRIAFLLSFLLIIGVVGGMENMGIKTGTGIIISLMLCGVFCISGIALERLEDQNGWD